MPHLGADLKEYLERDPLNKPNMKWFARVALLILSSLIASLSLVPWLSSEMIQSFGVFKTLYSFRRILLVFKKLLLELKSSNALEPLFRASKPLWRRYCNTTVHSVDTESPHFPLTYQPFLASPIGRKISLQRSLASPR